MVFVSLTGLVLLAISYLGYSSAQNQLLKNVDNQMLSQVEKNSSEFNGWLMQKAQIVETLAVTIENTAGNNPISKSYLQAFQNDPDISDIYIGFADKSFLDGGDWVPPADYDPTQRVWYTQALENGKLTFSEPYIDLITKQFVVSACIPLKNPDGSIRGVLGEDILLNTLTEKVKKINIDNHGFAFLLDQKGTFLAHPQQDFLGKNIAETEGYQDISQTLLSQEKGKFNQHIAGEDMIIVYQKIPSTGWTLAVMLPEKIAYAELSKLKIKYIIFALIMLAIALAATFIVAERITRPIKVLSLKSEEIAAGNLTVKVNFGGDDEIKHLADAFNHISSSLRSLIQKIIDSASIVEKLSADMHASTEEARQVSEQIAATVSDLAQGAGEQAKSVEKGAYMVENIYTAMQRITDNVQNSTHLADQTRQEVEKGFKSIVEQIEITGKNMEAADLAAESIQELAEKSQRIEKIVEVISSIAEQTNLLALNAAIEAARAGDAGRGFAVVADEVRKLAEETANSSREIAALIQENLTSMEKAVKQMEATQKLTSSQEKSVQEVKTFFDNIKTRTEEIASQLKEIASAVDEISLNTQEVADTISSLASIAEENAASTQETAAATEEQSASIQLISEHADKLLAEAQKLREETSVFRI